MKEVKTQERTVSFEEQFQEKVGKSFNEYYAKYYPKLVWQIQRINIGKLDAEDLANRAFVQSLEKIHMYNNKYHYSTWVFDIGKKMAYQYKKDNAKITLVDTSVSASNDDENSGVQYYLNNEIDKRNTRNDEHKISELKYKETLKEISKLSPKYKEIMELITIHDKSYNDVCDILNIELQTVKNRMHHGRKKIEKAVDEKFRMIMKHY